MAPRLFAFVFGLATLLGATAAEPPPRREELEALLDNAAEIRLADQEADLATARLRQAEADQGLKLFGNAGVADVREPLTDTTSRSYQRLSAVAGLRLPLFGSRALESEAVQAATAGIRQGELRRAVARREVRKALHYAYSEAVRFAELAAMATAFLAGQEQAEQVLPARQRAGLLLAADRLEFASMFMAASRNQQLFAARAAAARRRVEALSGRPVTAERLLYPPSFRTECLDAVHLEARAGTHPELAMAAAALDEARRRVVAERSVAEGGVVLSQSVTRDLGGQGGAATYLGVDFRVPFGWRGLSDARQAQARLEVARAELDLQQRREGFANAVVDMRASVEQQQGAVRMAKQRVAAANEALRVAELRAVRLEGDALEKLLQAKYALYLTATEYLEALLASEKAQADVLGLGDECPSVVAEGVDPQADPDLPARLAAPLPVRGDRAGPLDAAVGGAPGSLISGPLGWYVWDSELLLARAADESAWRELVADTRLLRLSFTAEQIANLADDAVATRLRSFLAGARAAGIRVELLLGEPTWVMPEARHRLLEIVQGLRRFPFDGLHLDLEQSQLPDVPPAVWDAWVVATVRAVKSASPWPLGLSGHLRDFSRKSLVRRLGKAGVDELTVMAYQTDWQRVAERVDRILHAHPQLKVSVAQSIEPNLAASESFAAQGRAGARRAWSSLAQRLARRANFAGIVVQSLERFYEVGE